MSRSFCSFGAAGTRSQAERRAQLQLCASTGGKVGAGERARPRGKARLSEVALERAVFALLGLACHQRHLLTLGRGQWVAFVHPVLGRGARNRAARRVGEVGADVLTCRRARNVDAFALDLEAVTAGERRNALGVCDPCAVGQVALEDSRVREIKLACRRKRLHETAPDPHGIARPRRVGRSVYSTCTCESAGWQP